MPSIAVPVMPLRVSKEDASESVADELSSNAWHETETPAPIIELVPFYYFNYDVYIETKDEESHSQSVTDARSGKGCVNAIKNVLDDVCAELINPELVEQTFESEEEQEVKVRKPLFESGEAKESIQIKVAAKEGVPKNNVLLSGIKLVFVPFWVFNVQLEEDNKEKIELRMNGINGSFDHEESPVPYRGKTKTELVSETVQDLKSPANWVSYFSQTIRGFLEMLNPNQPHPNRWMLIFLLVLVVLFLIGIGFIKFPLPA
jgi:hypothetical protein